MTSSQQRHETMAARDRFMLVAVCSVRTALCGPSVRPRRCGWVLADCLPACRVDSLLRTPAAINRPNRKKKSCRGIAVAGATNQRPREQSRAPEPGRGGIKPVNNHQQISMRWVVSPSSLYVIEPNTSPGCKSWTALFESCFSCVFQRSDQPYVSANARDIPAIEPSGVMPTKGLSFRRRMHIQEVHTIRKSRAESRSIAMREQ